VDWYHFGLGSHLLGLIGIGVGIPALIANLKRFRANTASHEARRLRLLAIFASLLGLVVFALTCFVAVEAPTVEGPILNYGWPFIVATTDRYGADNYLWLGVAFWVLVPQGFVYLYGRLLYRESLPSSSTQSTEPLPARATNPAPTRARILK
jgi:hypothetical protein